MSIMSILSSNINLKKIIKNIKTPIENIRKTHRHFRHGLEVKKGEVFTPPILVSKWVLSKKATRHHPLQVQLALGLALLLG